MWGTKFRDVWHLYVGLMYCVLLSTLLRQQNDRASFRKGTSSHPPPFLPLVDCMVGAFIFLFLSCRSKKAGKGSNIVHQLNHMPARHPAPPPRSSNTVTLACLTGFLAIPSITSPVHGNFLSFLNRRSNLGHQSKRWGNKNKIALYALREAFCLTSISIVTPLRRRPTLPLFDAHISVPPQPLNLRSGPRRLLTKGKYCQH